MDYYFLNTQYPEKPEFFEFMVIHGSSTKYQIKNLCLFRDLTLNPQNFVGTQNSKLNPQNFVWT